MSSAIRCFFLLCVASTLNAQTAEEEPKFAVELQRGEDSQPTYSLVPREPAVGQSASFLGQIIAPLSRENAAAGEQKKPCVLGLDYREEGNRVSIVASLYFEACDMRDLGLLEHNQHGQLVGKYSAGLNETVVLEEMKQFGLEPYTIKIVNAQVPNPVGPPTLSKVPSLQLEMVGEDRSAYKLVIHNLSPQAVTGYVVERSFEGGRNTIMGYGGGTTLIAPGADDKLQLSSESVSCAPPEGSAASEPVPCPIILEGAIFADGSYSGDAMT